jgi:ribosome biogenesis GTPase
MAKRRLSQQQKRRIKQAQQCIDLNDENNLLGRVISHHGGEIEVQPLPEDEEKKPNVHCNLRTNLGLIVCGDHVIYRFENNSPSILAIQPRKSFLQRLDGFGQLKAVAANVTQILICLSIEPEPNLFLLDQYLLSAEQQNLNAVIVLNKIDLVRGNSSDPFDLKKIYQGTGYPILYTSIIENQNIDSLQQLCRDQVNVISGVSGVGKSSLTKAILPQQEIRIREISHANKEGRHTTRTSRLYHLPLGGDLIDTPGVRGFNPVVDPNQPIVTGFREINAQGQLCKFSNCRHINEPGCAVIAAVSDHSISSGRYANYLKLLQECQ